MATGNIKFTDGKITENITYEKTRWNENLINHFLNCILGKEKPISDFKTGEKVIEIIEKAYISDEKGIEMYLK